MDDAQRDELMSELDNLVEENQTTLQRLTREGIQIDGNSIAGRQQAFVIQKMWESLPEDTRLEWNVEWQREMKQVLHNTGRNARQQRLLQGGHIPKNGSGLLGPNGQGLS